MILRHYYDGQVTRQWTVKTAAEAAEIVRRERGTKNPPRFTRLAHGYELKDGQNAIYELTTQ